MRAIPLYQAITLATYLIDAMNLLKIEMKSQTYLLTKIYVACTMSASALVFSCFT